MPNPRRKERRGLLQKLYLAVHRRVFARRLREQTRFPDRYIVSVGNLSAGGTGKTPAVWFLAEHARDRRPLAVLRGYGGKASKQGVLVSDGKELLAGWKDAGDEAVLLAGLPGLRVAAGARRADMIQTFGGDSELILLDDAFQNPSVYRDHDLVLMDASVPSELLRLLPTGRLREPFEALERAHSVLLTRVDQASPTQLSELRQRIEEFLPAERIFESVHRVLDVEPAPGEGPIGAFCGIGNPESFYRALGAMGHAPAVKRTFRDHHDWSASELRALAAEGRERGLQWITTEKDRVRLQNRPDLPEGFLESLSVLRIRLEILGGREEKFLRLVLGTAG